MPSPPVQDDLILITSAGILFLNKFMSVVLGAHEFWGTLPPSTSGMEDSSQVSCSQSHPIHPIFLFSVIGLSMDAGFLAPNMMLSEYSKDCGTCISAKG